MREKLLDTMWDDVGVVRGKITTASGTTLTGLCVFVKPPPKK